MRRRGWAVVLGLVVLASCARGPEWERLSEPYLLVWAGDADRKDPDFLAVIDANARSSTYGKVLKTYPVRSSGNEPYGLIAGQRDDRRVFATGLLSNRVFVFDMTNPLEGRLIAVDDGQGSQLSAPHDVVSGAGGHVVVTYPDRLHYRGEPKELLRTPGGLREFDAAGKPVREVSDIDPRARGFIQAPAGAAVSGGVLVTTSRGHGLASTTRGAFIPGIAVQTWSLADLTLTRTSVLEAGARGEENTGPLAVTALHTKPHVLVATHEGGALYACDAIGAAEPVFRRVFDFGVGALPAGAAITPDDRWYVQALPGKHRLVLLDAHDLFHPTMAYGLRFDRDPADEARPRKGGPSGVVLSADGNRVAVADYTMDVPGYHLDGDHRVYLVRIEQDPSAHLRFDTAFKDEKTGEVGVDFDRTHWPHGDTGPARPHGMLFVSAAPPRE
jgi:hypothetical protein